MPKELNQSISEELDEFLKRVLKDDGLAVRSEDHKCFGLYYTATTIGTAKLRIKDFLQSKISQALAARDRELREKVKDMLLQIPNPYGKWVSVENVNKKIIGKIIALLEEK